jgi:hypothetical protein
VRTFAFEKGFCQEFKFPLDKLLDLSAYSVDNLVYNSLRPNFYPFVIHITATGELEEEKSVRAQSTYATLESNNDGSYSLKPTKVKVMVSAL